MIWFVICPSLLINQVLIQLMLLIEIEVPTFCVCDFGMTFYLRVAEAPQFEDEWIQRTSQYAPRQDRSAVNHDQHSRHRPVDNRRYQSVLKWMISVHRVNALALMWCCLRMSLHWMLFLQQIINTRRGRSRGGSFIQGWEKILGSVFPGIIISWKHIQLNNIICAIFHT